MVTPQLSACICQRSEFFQNENETQVQAGAILPAERKQPEGNQTRALTINPVAGSALVWLMLETQWPLMEPTCHADYTRCGNWDLILTVTQGNTRNERPQLESRLRPDYFTLIKSKSSTLFLSSIFPSLQCYLCPRRHVNIVNIL